MSTKIALLEKRVGDNETAIKDLRTQYVREVRSINGVLQEVNKKIIKFSYEMGEVKKLRGDIRNIVIGIITLIITGIVSSFLVFNR